MLRANITRVTREYKQVRRALLFTIDKLISGSSFEVKAFFKKPQNVKLEWRPSTSGLVAKISPMYR